MNPFKWVSHHVGILKWEYRYRFTPRHRYHIVNTGLRPGMHETDERMLHACMTLLVEHIEHCYGDVTKLEEFTADLRDNPGPFVPEGAADGQVVSQSEAVAIYRWWKHERPADHERLHKWMMLLFDGELETWTDEKGGSCFGSRQKPDESMGDHSAYFAFQDSLHEKDQAMLHRLIDIRQSLWM